MKAMLLAILVVLTACTHSPRMETQSTARGLASWPLGVEPFDLLKKAKWEMDCSTTIGLSDPGFGLIIAKSSFFEYYDPRSRSNGSAYVSGLNELNFFETDKAHKTVRAYEIHYEESSKDVFGHKTQDFPVKMSRNYYEDPIVEINFKSFRTSLARITHHLDKEKFAGPLWVTVTGAPDRLVGACILNQKD